MGPSLNKKCKLVSLCPINCNHIHKLATTDFQFPSEIVIYDIGFRQKRYLMMQEQFEYVLQKSKQHDDIPFNPAIWYVIYAYPRYFVYKMAVC